MEGFLIVPDFLMQRFTLLGFDAAVAELENTFAEKAHGLVVELKVELHQPQRFGAVEEVEDVGFVLVRGAGQNAERNILAEHGGALEHCPVTAVEGGDLVGDNVLERLRQIVGIELLKHPTLAGQHDLLVGYQFADNLAEKQRVAFG